MTFGSLFAGIEGFGLGFERAGMKCRWQVEKDRDALRVLAHHWPDVPKVDDVCKAGAANLGPVDVICFGSPCQDLSVAGKRAGLEGERSGLFFEAIRIVRELRPAIAIWENVPGAFSSNAGRDFLSVLAAFRECGARDIGWRVIDAQYLNVAQRRERVFVVADFRGERVGQILFESACGCRHPAPGREAGAGVAGGASFGISSDCFDRSGEAASGSAADRPGLGIVEEASPALRAKRPNGVAHVVGEDVAHALRSVGADASEDGTGRGTQLAVVPIQTPNMIEKGHGGVGVGRDGDPMYTLETTQPHGIAYNVVSMAMQGKNHAYQTEVSGCLQHKGLLPTGNEAGTVIAWTQQTRDGVPNVETQEELAYTLDAPKDGGRKKGGVQSGMMVRRLTPTECCRLQGFPDDWLNLTPPISDSAKYRLLGNAVCVNVSEWIGRRILEATGGG